MPEVLIRKDHGKRAYRLRCRFKVGAYPLPSWLEKAKYAAADQFVKDMRTQGYEYMDKFGFKLLGPFVPLVVTNLPSRHMQANWQVPSREMLPMLKAGRRFLAPPDPYAMTNPSLEESEGWEYELAGVFVHKAILMETPDSHEEKERLARR